MRFLKRKKMEKIDMFSRSVTVVLDCLLDQEFRGVLNYNIGDDLIDDLYEILVELNEKANREYDDLLH